MAKERRVLRLQQLILELVAESVQRDVGDPRVGLVSITRIKLSSDLSIARVYWSALGDETTLRTTERGLSDALPIMQHAVARGLSTRITPRLALQFDEMVEKASRLEEIFLKVHLENRERGLKADGTPRDDVAGETAEETAAETAEALSDDEPRVTPAADDPAPTDQAGDGSDAPKDPDVPAS